MCGEFIWFSWLPKKGLRFDSPGSPSKSRSFWKVACKSKKLDHEKLDYVKIKLKRSS